MQNFAIPSHIESALLTLECAGFSAYLVGGCVRDAVLGRSPTDWDVATSAHPNETARIFPKTVMTGERYGTVTVLLPECTVEVTTFRADGVYLDNRRPESVAFGGDLAGDLSRRDFTMNAMAISRDGELIDPHNGLRDIESLVIRCVGEPERRFREDALRMLRALRFSAQLGFTIEPETLSAIKRLAPLASALSSERVRDELQRTLLSGRPEIIADMIKYGLLAPRVRDSGKFPEKLSKISDLPFEPPLRWCAFFAVIAGTGLVGSVSDFARAMRLDNKTVSVTAIGAELALTGIPPDAAGIKRLLAKCGEAALLCAAAAHEVLHNEPRRDAVQAVISSGECYTIKKLAVTGQDLIEAGVSQGTQIGIALGALLSHVIEHPEDNRREILMKLLPIVITC